MDKKELKTLLQVTAREVSQLRYLLDCAKEDYRMLEEKYEALETEFKDNKRIWGERADYEHVQSENERLERIVNRMKAEALA